MDRLSRVTGKRTGLLVGLALMAIALAMVVFTMSCVPIVRNPKVDIISPGDCTTVTDTVTIEANASHGSGISVVEYSTEEAVGYLVIGGYVAMELVSGDVYDGVWRGYWDTTAVEDGFYKITVRAIYSVWKGYDSVMVVVDNVPPEPGSGGVYLRAEVRHPCYP